ncbi:MAG: hypothetical protein LC737_00140, partial [Chloroflexi bacterium]|nr:hypothetical protein [Chloroflexota bacterium]
TVNVGDSVSVSGIVSEFRAGGSSSDNLTVTELTSPSIVIVTSGNALPAPIIIGTGGRIPPTTIIEDDASDVETGGVFDPANDGIDFYESLEGMLVQVNNAVVVGPTVTFGGGSNRELPVLGDNGVNASVRTVRGGIVVRMGDFNPERVILNDLIAGGPILPPAVVNDTFPGSILGIMDYNFGNFKLEVTTLPSLVSGGLVSETTGFPTAAQIAIGNYNVENLSVTDTMRIPQLASIIVNNLHSPDLITLQEIQDDSGFADTGAVSPVQTLNAITTAIQSAGGPLYDFREIDPVNDQDGGAPGGNIRQVFLFRTDRGLQFVDRPGGGSTTDTAVVDNGGTPNLQFSPGRIKPNDSAFTSSRKPLAGEFLFQGHRFFVIANHFISKGGDDPLFGRHQPPVLASEAQRIQQAQIVHDFVAAILAIDPNADVLVQGDLNDFEFSNPLLTLKGTSPQILNDLIEALPQNERYTYEFDGNAQALDHIMVSNHLFGTAAIQYDIVHVNAEFLNSVRESDHDPEVALVTLSSPTAVRLESFGVLAASSADPLSATLVWAGAAGVLLGGIVAGLTIWRTRRHAPK